MIKTNIRDLALFGGAPAFQEKLHVGRPNVGNRERFLQRVHDILDRRWFTNDGPYVQEFEARIAALVNVKHCLAMCNGTVALEIAVRATGLTGEVIVPSFTFIATAHALQWQGITPVFCDVALGTHHIDPQQVGRLITPRTTGIIGVHTWGKACDIDALTAIARRRNLRLLFDAAHAFTCSYQAKMIGGFGDIEVFSFHATKFLHTFEGGAVTTNNDDLAQKMRLMRNFGFAGYDNVQYIGTNGKLPEVSAAIGLTLLDSLEELIETNYQRYKQYQQSLAGLPGIKLVTYDESEKCNYQYVVLEVDESATGLTRDDLVRILTAENVLARRYFYPGCHQMEPYRSYFPHAGLLLPHTNQLVGRVMTLPTGTAVDANDIQVICELIAFAVANSEGIREELSKC